MKLERELALPGPRTLSPAQRHCSHPACLSMRTQPSHEGRRTSFPCDGLRSPPYHGVFILKKAFSFGFSKELPRAIQSVLRHKLKQAVFPVSGEDEGPSTRYVGLGT